MRTLQLNPQKHEIELYDYSDKEQLEHGFALISYQFGETEAEHSFTADDARKVGEWFIKLSKQIDKAEKSAS